MFVEKKEYVLKLPRERERKKEERRERKKKLSTMEGGEYIARYCRAIQHIALQQCGAHCMHVRVIFKKINNR